MRRSKTPQCAVSALVTAFLVCLLSSHVAFAWIKCSCSHVDGELGQFNGEWGCVDDDGEYVSDCECIQENDTINDLGECVPPDAPVNNASEEDEISSYGITDYQEGFCLYGSNDSGFEAMTLTGEARLANVLESTNEEDVTFLQMTGSLLVDEAQSVDWVFLLDADKASNMKMEMWKDGAELFSFEKASGEDGPVTYPAPIEVGSYTFTITWENDSGGGGYVGEVHTIIESPEGRWKSDGIFPGAPCCGLGNTDWCVGHLATQVSTMDKEAFVEVMDAHEGEFETVNELNELISESISEGTIALGVTALDDKVSPEDSSDTLYIGVAGGVAGAFAVFVAVIVFVRKSKRTKTTPSSMAKQTSSSIVDRPTDETVSSLPQHSFEFGELIGKGLASKVFRCISGGREYAIKTFSRQMFSRAEAGYSRCQSVHHDNVIQPQRKFKNVNAEGEYGIMTKLAPHNLMTWMDMYGEDELKVAMLLKAICETMDVLRSHNQLHGNLTPANVLVTVNHFPLLSDFAPSASVNLEEEMSYLHLRYLPPEIIKGHTTNMTERVDVWMFALTVLAAVSQCEPYAEMYPLSPDASQELNSVKEAMENKVPQYNNIATFFKPNGKLPAILRPVFMQCLSIMPQTRPTWGAVMAKLEVHLSSAYSHTAENQFGALPKKLPPIGGGNSTMETKTGRTFDSTIVFGDGDTVTQFPGNAASILGNDGTLEDFELGDMLGSGGQGYARVARRKEDGQMGVLKLTQVIGLKRSAREMVLSEARLLSQLEHENVIRYFDWFVADNSVCIFMEFAGGGSLEDALLTVGSMRCEEVTRVGRQVLLGLMHMHEKKILHRDLKPANIFLSEDGTAKIGDLGIARQMEHTVSMANTMVGTPYYLSPEVCNGQPYDAKADVWSFGCTMYQLLAGDRPFVGANVMAVVRAIMEGTRKPLPNFVPDPLKDAIDQCLNHEASERISVGELLNHEAFAIV